MGGKILSKGTAEGFIVDEICEPVFSLLGLLFVLEGVHLFVDEF